MRLTSALRINTKSHPQQRCTLSICMWLPYDVGDRMLSKRVEPVDTLFPRQVCRSPRALARSSATACCDPLNRVGRWAPRRLCFTGLSAFGPALQCQYTVLCYREEPFSCCGLMPCDQASHRIVSNVKAGRRAHFGTASRSGSPHVFWWGCTYPIPVPAWVHDTAARERQGLVCMCHVFSVQVLTHLTGCCSRSSRCSPISIETNSMVCL